MGTVIRQLKPDDRDAIQEMLTECGAFNDEEVLVGLEVFDEGVAGGVDGPYPHFGVIRDASLCGYVCVGSTPLTDATWHLYWICVHPEAQRHGYGKALLEYAEEFVRTRGGARLVIETGGSPDYAGQRNFYERNGYREVGRIPDFYQAGDDGVIYWKHL